jgi:hypothetical protein
VVLIAGGAFLNGLYFITQPYQLNYGEGLVAWQVAHITDPARAYAPIDQYPFMVFQYPPLFHLATRAMAGMRTGDLLMAGRSVSVLSAAILCVIVGWITFQTLPRRVGWQTRLLAAVLAGALPTTLYNFSWTWSARVDALAVLLALSGVGVFATRPNSALVQILAAALMTAALFTKQTALAAPLACVLLALVIDRRIALRMLLLLSILGGAGLAWLAWWSHGQVLLHLFRYNQNPFSIGRAMFGLAMNTRYVAGLLILAAGAAVAVLTGNWRLARRGRWALLGANLRVNSYRRRVFLLALYSVLAGLTAMAFGKEGSDINYFLEWNIALAPLAGVLLFRAVPRMGGLVKFSPARLAVLALPVLLLDAGFDQARTGWLRTLGTAPAADRQRAEVFEQALAEVQGTPGPVFSEDMELLYKSGKDIPAEPAMIQCLAKAGMWDERPFVRLIQERSFGLVVAYDLSSPERYSPAVSNAIRSAYQQTMMIGDYRIYRPRPGVPDSAANVR